MTIISADDPLRLFLAELTKGKIVIIISDNAKAKSRPPNTAAAATTITGGGSQFPCRWEASSGSSSTQPPRTTRLAPSPRQPLSRANSYSVIRQAPTTTATTRLSPLLRTNSFSTVTTSRKQFAEASKAIRLYSSSPSSNQEDCPASLPCRWEQLTLSETSSPSSSLSLPVILRRKISPLLESSNKMVVLPSKIILSPPCGESSEESSSSSNKKKALFLTSPNTSQLPGSLRRPLYNNKVDTVLL
jgi:hypothetical protein